jgi:putative ATPase
MDDLFADAPGRNAPLAARFRPTTLEEYVGQSHLLAPGKPLRRLIEADRLTSLILFGAPGVGKTSLAEVIARRTECHFERLNGVEGTVADLRRVLAAASTRQRASGKRTVLFIDEIHRFNKAQQDVLLPDVEAGTVRLIGATTHNPSFYINGPLVSRSQIFQLESLSSGDLSALIDRALADPERGLGQLKIELTATAREHLIATAEGDARRVLNGLELAALTTAPDAKGVVRIDEAAIEECVQKKRVLYDRDEDQHYDTISAFIKSVRGSDPDSALYWLAKMIEAGEDPRFIARRLVILASEDIGLADPLGLPMAVAALQAVEFIGMPEGRLTLAHATLHLACAPKSNSATLGIGAAQAAVQEGEVVPVPRALRDAHYPGAKKLGHGEGYQYSHDFPGGIAPQRYGIEPGRFYQPTDHGHEARIKARLREWEALRAKFSAEKTSKS